MGKKNTNQSLWAENLALLHSPILRTFPNSVLPQNTDQNVFTKYKNKNRYEPQ